MAETHTKAAVAKVKVMADLQHRGYELLLPFNDHLPFDLVAYRSERFARVQVKYSTSGKLRNETGWIGKTSDHHRKYSAHDFDYYAVYLPAVDKVIYPSVSFGRCYIAVKVPKSPKAFYWYEDFLGGFTDTAVKRSYKEFGVVLPWAGVPKPERQAPGKPSREELAELLWQQPLTHLARRYGVSDSAVFSWAKEYGLKTPGRGYWQRVRVKHPDGGADTTSSSEDEGSGSIPDRGSIGTVSQAGD